MSGVAPVVGSNASFLVGLPGAAFLALGTVPLLHGLRLIGSAVPALRLPIYQPLG